MEEIYNALHDLKASVDKQNELQETTHALLRALIDALNSNAQELADFRAGSIVGEG